MPAQVVYRSATVRALYKPHRRDIAKIAVGRHMKAALNDITHNIAKPYAVGISPRDTGEYAKSFFVYNTFVTLPKRFPMRRVASRLINTSGHAAAIEFGNEHVRRPHRVLGQTLDMLTATLPVAKTGIDV